MEKWATRPYIPLSTNETDEPITGACGRIPRFSQKSGGPEPLAGIRSNDTPGGIHRLQPDPGWFCAETTRVSNDLCRRRGTGHVCQARKVTPLKRLYAIFAGMLIATLGLGAADVPASRTKSGTRESEPAAPPPLIWPLPPDPPRVRWVAQYTDMAKVKPSQKKSAWLEKLTGTRPPDESLELRKPYGVTTDRRGRIYIADTELQSVFIVDPRTKTVERRQASSRAPMSLPVGLAVDADDRLFVSDAALHSLICFTPAGAPVALFGTSALGRPGGIAIDPQRHRLYVADAKESRIAVFDTTNFKLIGYYGGPGKPGQHENGTFLGPTNVALDRQGNIYVSDTGNCRIQILDPAGKFVRTFGQQGDRPGEFIRPKGIAVDSEGHVYVADAEFNNFQILTAQGQPLLAVGVLGGEPGQFTLIAGLAIDTEDQVYTTEMFRGRVQVFHYIAQNAAVQAKAAVPGSIR